MSLLSYLGALALTLAVELAVTGTLAPAARRRRALTTCALLNLTTHPLATWLALHFDAFVALEVGVVFAEAAGYLGVARLSPTRAALVALVGNLGTALVGLWYWG